MTENTLKITIDRPRDIVFKYSIDPAHSPDWIDSFAEEVTSEWPPKLGTVYRNRNQAGDWTEYTVEALSRACVSA